MNEALLTLDETNIKIRRLVEAQLHVPGSLSLIHFPELKILLRTDTTFSNIKESTTLNFLMKMTNEIRNTDMLIHSTI
ncbi:hypothetical protein T11_14899 [Trichinella zimbabwensis]|uniref:Uncharacterized protein n=1 Tax=Trichinella zimbabwensis TaxID=268475 RepID=A0A0V1I1W6_9BILA|nr:hypothetical protein T11_14899 [Trichinella zimbabwensis]